MAEHEIDFEDVIRSGQTPRRYFSEGPVGYIYLKVPVLLKEEGGGYEESPYSYLASGPLEMLDAELPEGVKEMLIDEFDHGDFFYDYSLSDLADFLKDPPELKAHPKLF